MSLMTGERSGEMSEQVKGIIYEAENKVYAPLSQVFAAIDNKHLDYQWLITNVIAYPENERFAKFFSEQVQWLSGEDLDKIIAKEDFQWVWAYMSGFPKGTTLDEVLEYDLPFADHQKKGWYPEKHIQHPLAVIEIVPWDSTKVIILAKDSKVIDSFRAHFPTASEL